MSGLGTSKLNLDKLHSVLVTICRRKDNMAAIDTNGPVKVSFIMFQI